MTLVQASIASDGDAVILTSDRLLSRRLSPDVPHYEFEGKSPKIIAREIVGIGFAGSQLHADSIAEMVRKDGLQDFDELTEEISSYIQSERERIIHNEIQRRTGIDDPTEFFMNPSLPIPEEVRRNIYGYMGETDHSIVNAQCLLAGFDSEEDARIAVVDDEGDVIEATHFGEIAIGSGSQFSTIYFDQHDYSIECEFGEAVLFNFEAKKWAEAPSGVGAMTDMMSIRRVDGELELIEIPDGSPLLAKMERYHKEQKEHIRDERKELRDKLTKELVNDT